MKLDTDVMLPVILAALFIFTMHLYSKVKNQQTQIDELRIIVNQKFLPAMILDKENLGIR